jgi:hypothetical protein
VWLLEITILSLQDEIVTFVIAVNKQVVMNCLFPFPEWIWLVVVVCSLKVF